ncbi:uncharacterized protein LOC127878484 [Dreissena polymorpha]|uniref:uncharacterized protein LOC127878484 n=1 Tax=Dreissena polymorpha TaxID=45954 RepID=UPI0022648608|nr:uncharacterized protein LOC127878484 [Dreissena polymorpha]
MDGNSSELQDLTHRLYVRARTYWMEVSTEKSNIMGNSTTNNSANIAINGEKLEEVTRFKYFGETLSKNSNSNSLVRIRIPMATAAMARLSRLCTSSSIRFNTKFRLYKSLVVPIRLYSCETWHGRFTRTHNSG